MLGRSEDVAMHHHEVPMPQRDDSRRRGKVFRWVVGVIVVLAIAWYFADSFIPLRVLSAFHPNYQAVFLSNGQVYFGKMYREANRYPILRDIYYLQITQPPQPIPQGQTPPTNINLVKLGGELHGPSDEMRINRQQILFIEDLKADSRVAQAIKDFKESNK